MFSQDYAYFSSFSNSWLAHAKEYVMAMQQRLRLNAHSCVVEVAANDGYLLQYVNEAGIPCYGIEPTASTAAAARVKGIEMVERFFGVALAHELVYAGRKADLIIANNVLAHVPDINDFVAGISHLLKPYGVATFEFPHLLRMVQGYQFDTAYHEHYSYLSLTVVKRICAANGLKLIDVETLPTHGGSLRVFAVRADAINHPQATSGCNSRVQQLLAEESKAGMLEEKFYSGFQDKALYIKRVLLSFLLHCQAQGVTVGAYGAAAKGNTLLNFAGVRPDLLPYVVDKNPAKIGMYMPGSRIPIVDEVQLINHQPDRVLILPWNLRDELAFQLGYVRDWGGQLVVVVPQLEII
jgi:SAM-dependent methyltransferase